MAERWPIEPGKYEYTRSDGAMQLHSVSSRQVPVSGSRPSQPDAEGRFSGTMDNGVTAQMRKIG